MHFHTMETLDLEVLTRPLSLPKVDSSDSVASSGSSSSSRDYPANDSLRKHAHKRRHRRQPIIQFEHALEQLPALPSSFLSANPSLSQAMSKLQQQTRRFSNPSLSLEREVVIEPANEPVCLDRRLERAIAFSGSFPQRRMSAGLQEAMTLIGAVRT